MTEERKPCQLTSAMATIAVGTFSLFLTGAVSLIYTPIKDGLSDVRDEVEKMKADPSPKPETRVELEALKERVAAMQREHARLDERLNNFHIFIMQYARPDSRPLPPAFQRRGDFQPFMPDMPVTGVN